MHYDVNKVADLICNSKHAVALTGAGISTLSGIPDFRSPATGLWSRFSAETIFRIDHFYSQPEDFFSFAKEFIYTLADAKPSIIHNLLSLLQSKGLIRRVITQNIDTLHQKAGSQGVLELHGSPLKNYCVRCESCYSFDEMRTKINRDTIARCDKCQNIVKPDIIFFGELLHENVLQAAFNETEKSDCCIVLGSSLVVYPAASIPDMIKRNGAKLIIVNRDRTPYDSRADITLNMDLQSFGEELIDILKKRNIIGAS